MVSWLKVIAIDKIRNIQKEIIFFRWYCFSFFFDSLKTILNFDGDGIFSFVERNYKKKGNVDIFGHISEITRKEKTVKNRKTPSL